MGSNKKISTIQYKILDRLFFTEPFTRLVEEMSEPRTVIGAELKDLMVKSMVQSMEYDEKRSIWRKTIYYDSDNMHAFHYRITGKGMEAYEVFDRSRL